MFSKALGGYKTNEKGGTYEKCTVK